jgi:hypothetical protein
MPRQQAPRTAREAARAELYASVPAHNHDDHRIERSAFYGRQDRPTGRAARLAVIGGAELTGTAAVGPRGVARGSVATQGDEG